MRSQRVDGDGVRRSRRLRIEGSPASVGRTDRGSEARRKFDVVVCWRLDRLGRNLRHLVVLLDELNAMGVSFVSLNEGISHTLVARWRAVNKTRREAVVETSDFPASA